MSRMRDYRAKLGSIFDIPPDTYSDAVSVEIRDFREVMLHGCTGILSYSPAVTVLGCRAQKVTVSGSDLRLTVFSERDILICGKIESVIQGEGSGK